MKGKIKSKKELHDDAWKLVSRYVRQSVADPFTGYSKCFTCGAVKHWKELQAGHFWHGMIDFDLRNLKSQCTKCNYYRSGELATYSSKLIQEYGQEWFVKLDRDAHQHPGYTIEEIKEVIKKFKQLIKKL